MNQTPMVLALAGFSFMMTVICTLPAADTALPEGRQRNTRRRS
jgi:hypothetical protein